MARILDDQYSDERPITSEGERPNRGRVSKMFSGMNGYIIANIFLQIAFGIYNSCFYAVLAPMARQFHFSDSKIGFINTADDIGRIPFLLITAYFGSRWHIPRVLGFTGCVYAIIAVTIVIPYFIFKHGKGADELAGLTTLLVGQEGNQSNITTLNRYLCNESDISMKTEAIYNMEFSDNFAYYLMIVASFFLGAVASPWNSLYVWYIDENSDKSKFPLLLGILNSTTMVGPIIGTYLATAVNKVYVDLSNTEMSPKDPMFIGAWWLGLLISASLCLIACPFLCCFPRTMKTDEDIKAFLKEATEKNLLTRRMTVTARRASMCISTIMEPRSSFSQEVGMQLRNRDLALIYENENDDKEMSPSERKKHYTNVMANIYRPKNVPRLLMRLLRNPVYMMFIFVQVAWRYEYGKDIFIFKYFAAQFNMPDWEASAVLGVQATISSVLSAVGTFVGGFLVYRHKPTFAQATLFCLIIYTVASLIATGQMFLGCDNIKMYGTSQGPHETSMLRTACNLDCSCNTFAYKPVCDRGITYFTPCHAGCSGTNSSLFTSPEFYYDCACTASGTARNGACDRTCSNYYIYISLDVLKAFIDSTTWSAIILLILRCVDSTEKALALGFRSFIASLLSIPVALLYGRVIDSTCLVWQETMGNKSSRGVCWVFDFPTYRHRFWGIPIGFRLFEVAVETAIWLYARNKVIRMYDEEIKPEESQQLKKSSNMSTDTSDMYVGIVDQVASLDRVASLDPVESLA